MEREKFIKELNDGLSYYYLYAVWEGEQINIYRRPDDHLVYVCDNERVANAFFHGMEYVS